MKYAKGKCRFTCLMTPKKYLLQNEQLLLMYVLHDVIDVVFWKLVGINWFEWTGTCCRRNYPVTGITHPSPTHIRNILSFDHRFNTDVNLSHLYHECHWYESVIHHCSWRLRKGKLPAVTAKLGEYFHTHWPGWTTSRKSVGRGFLSSWPQTLNLDSTIYIWSAWDVLNLAIVRKPQGISGLHGHVLNNPFCPLLAWTTWLISSAEPRCDVNYEIPEPYCRFGHVN